MTDDEWGTFALLLDKGFKWREPFGHAQEMAYRMLLDGFDPPQIAGAIRSLVAGGQVFGPTPGEIVATIRADASAPTFEEAYALIYGRGGILRARPSRTEFADMGEMARAQHEARLDRAKSLHRLVGLFAVRYGIDRLAGLEVDHDDYGDLKRKELREAWDRHVEAFAGREIAAIAERSSGGRLKRLDPLAPLPVPRALIEGGDR